MNVIHKLDVAPLLRFTWLIFVIHLPWWRRSFWPSYVPIGRRMKRKFYCGLSSSSVSFKRCGAGNPTVVFSYVAKVLRSFLRKSTSSFLCMYPIILKQELLSYWCSKYKNTWLSVEAARYRSFGLRIVRNSESTTGSFQRRIRSFKALFHAERPTEKTVGCLERIASAWCWFEISPGLA